MKQRLIIILKKITREILAKHQPIIIGITGNVGKTTTRNALVGFLSEFTPVGSNYENYNSDLGVCLSIIGAKEPGKNPFKWLSIFWKGWLMTLNINPEFPPVWILEIGIDGVGDMDFFVQDFLEFDVIIFGFVGENPVHTENFGSRDALIYEKGKILRGLKEDGLLIINGDDPYIAHLYHKRKNVLTIGFEDTVDIQASDFYSSIRVEDTQEQWDECYTSLIPYGGFKIIHKGAVIPFKLDYLIGKQQVYNILPAIALGISDGINLVDIASKIHDLKPMKGRMRFMEGIKDSLLIDDSYNAAPAAMMAALETLSKLNIPDIRRIVALGEMKELGSASVEIHKKIGKYIAEKQIDIFIGVGINMKDAVSEYRLLKPDGTSQYFDDSFEAAEWIKNQIGSSDVLLVKGSQSSRMERVSSEVLANKRYRTELLPRQSDEWLQKV